jgi:hypothetical protein
LLVEDELPELLFCADDAPPLDVELATPAWLFELLEDPPAPPWELDTEEPPAPP